MACKTLPINATVKMKLGKLANPGFSKSFAVLLKCPKVPMRTNFKLRGLISTIDAQVTQYNATRTGLIDQYALKNEKGENVTEIIKEHSITRLIPERVKEYNSKILELESLDVEVPVIKFSELGENLDLDKDNTLGLTPEDVFNLEFIVV